MRSTFPQTEPTAPSAYTHTSSYTTPHHTTIANHKTCVLQCSIHIHIDIENNCFSLDFFLRRRWRVSVRARAYCVRFCYQCSVAFTRPTHTHTHLYMHCDRCYCSSFSRAGPSTYISYIVWRLNFPIFEHEKLPHTHNTGQCRQCRRRCQLLLFTHCLHGPSHFKFCGLLSLFAESLN